MNKVFIGLMIGVAVAGIDRCRGTGSQLVLDRASCAAIGLELHSGCQ